MTQLETHFANLRLLLASDIDPKVAELCRAELEHLGDCLAPWGRFLAPVTVATVASMRQLARASSAPVDGLLSAVAETQRVTLLCPDAWINPPSRLALRQTLAHELAHCLLFQRCAPPGREPPVALPTWFREGMAVLASEGAPTAGLWRRLDGRGDLHALAGADASLVGQDARTCYDLAHLLFFRWHDTFGARRLGSLSRQMRAGHPFETAFRVACKLPVEIWLAATIAQVRQGLTDDATLSRSQT